MDKFVVKSKVPVNQFLKSQSGYLKQTTIESLKGVVVVSELKNAKIILDNELSEESVKINTLIDLKKKNPCKDILIKTKLGKLVHKLCKSDNPNIAAPAKDLYRQWKKNILKQENRTSIEINGNSQIDRLRKKGIDLMTRAVQKCLDTVENGFSIYNHSQIVSICELVEVLIHKSVKEKFHKCYAKIIRKIIFALRYQKDMTLDLLNSKKSVENFANNFLDKP